MEYFGYFLFRLMTRISKVLSFRSLGDPEFRRVSVLYKTARVECETASYTARDYGVIEESRFEVNRTLVYVYTSVRCVRTSSANEKGGSCPGRGMEGGGGPGVKSRV